MPKPEGTTLGAGRWEMHLYHIYPAAGSHLGTACSLLNTCATRRQHQGSWHPVTTGISEHVRLCLFQTTLSFLAAETRLEALGEKWHQVCVLLSASLKTFGSCTLEVTLGRCQVCLMAEDGCKEVSHQSRSDSSLFPLPLLILGTGLMTPPGILPQGIQLLVFSVKMNEKCLLGHIKLSKEQLGLPVRGIIVKKAEILRKRDYESPVIFTVQIPIPYIST